MAFKPWASPCPEHSVHCSHGQALWTGQNSGILASVCFTSSFQNYNVSEQHKYAKLGWPKFKNSGNDDSTRWITKTVTLHLIRRYCLTSLNVFVFTTIGKMTSRLWIERFYVSVAFAVIFRVDCIYDGLEQCRSSAMLRTGALAGFLIITIITLVSFSSFPCADQFSCALSLKPCQDARGCLPFVECPSVVSGHGA